MTPRLKLNHVTKRYPCVVANDDVSLTVMPGEIHAVLGENGAGKSMLMKIIYGAVRPDAGRCNGMARRSISPARQWQGSSALPWSSSISPCSTR
jgi:ABC-type uncharacterized transport system ATPase subunit